MHHHNLPSNQIIFVIFVWVWTKLSKMKYVNKMLSDLKSPFTHWHLNLYELCLAENESSKTSCMYFYMFWGRRKRRGGQACMYFRQKVRGIDPLYWRDMPASLQICFWQSKLTSCSLLLILWQWWHQISIYMKLSQIKCDKLLLGAKLPCFSKIWFY